MHAIQNLEKIFRKTKMFLGVSTILLLPTFTLAKDYSGAELYSQETFEYGKFEARMLMAAGSGLVSSMFLYNDSSWMGGECPWVEVDIEILGKNPSSFQSNIITGNASAKVTSEKHHNLDVPANATYHTYAMEWTPTYVAWFVDGVLMRKTQIDSSDTKNQVAALIRNQSLRFNLWSSEVPAWVGAWDDSILPVHQYINWVKVYKYTPGIGENGSDFTLYWTDDFSEDFNSSRWGRGNWTFDENRVDMHPDNINVVDGTLIISITKAGEEGFSGTVPVDNGETNAIETRPINLGNRNVSFQMEPSSVAVILNIQNQAIWQICSVAGEVLLSGNEQRGLHYISYASLPTGTYWFRVRQNGLVYSAKLIRH